MISRKKIILISTLILLIPFIAAEESERIDWNESDFEYLHENIDPSELREEINSNQEDMPDFVANIVGDQRINVYFQQTNATYSAEMNGTLVEKLDVEELEDATLSVDVNETSLDAVIDSENSFEELRKQLDKGGIEYEALTTSNKVRFFITERILDLFSVLNIL